MLQRIDRIQLRVRHLERRVELLERMLMAIVNEQEEQKEVNGQTREGST